jgi:hypothetical protein
LESVESFTRDSARLGSAGQQRLKVACPGRQSVRNCRRYRVIGLIAQNF